MSVHTLIPIPSILHLRLLNFSEFDHGIIISPSSDLKKESGKDLKTLRAKFKPMKMLKILSHKD
jgi:hypothetical protein